jgi:hypothetical protein
MAVIVSDPVVGQQLGASVTGNCDGRCQTCVLCEHHAVRLCLSDLGVVLPAYSRASPVAAAAACLLAAFVFDFELQ